MFYKNIHFILLVLNEKGKLYGIDHLVYIKIRGVKNKQTKQKNCYLRYKISSKSKYLFTRLSCLTKVYESRGDRGPGDNTQNALIPCKQCQSPSYNYVMSN